MVQWFRGIRPIGWHGVAVAIIYCLLLAKVFISINQYSHSLSDTLIGFGPFLILITFLFGLVVKTTNQSL